MAFPLRARQVDIDTGGDTRVVLLRGHDAETLGINPGDQLQIRAGKRTLYVIADITHHSIRHGDLGIFIDVWKLLKVREGSIVMIEVISRPASIQAIKKKLLGQTFTEADVKAIISDIVSRRLGTIETTYFVSSGYVKPYTEQELIWMVKAMAETGEMFTWRTKYVVDKHSVGGLAGNRTTMIAIPIIASLGLVIPKTSSRAITSPSGTADTMEVLAPVSHDGATVRKIVQTTGGCLIWGGGLSIAPADDIIIRVSRPLSLEPYDKMIVSIMAKKVAMGVRYLVIDMPYGHGTKIPNRQVANSLVKKFQRIGRAFKMVVEVQFDPAKQPIGNGVGPALEARDVVRVLQQTADRPHDLESKGIHLAGQLLELCGRAKRGTGAAIARAQIKNGQAWKKMQDIIEAQGGNAKLKPDDVLKGAYTADIRSVRTGKVVAIDNRLIDELARSLGAPDHKLAGVYLHRKIGKRVRRGEILLTLSSHSRSRLPLAKALLRKVTIVRVGH